MARLAATEHGADWVVSSDADEFWWPRGGSLPEVLESIPTPLRASSGRSSATSSPSPTTDGPFAERMTLRLAAQAPVNDPRSPWRPFRKVVHRGHPAAEVIEGSHSVGGTGLVPMRGWYPIEVLHFPIRTAEQLERKGRLWGAAVEKFYAGEEVVAGPGAAYHALSFQDSERGRSAEVFDELVGTGASSGRRPSQRASSSRTCRLRDALRSRG